MDTAVTNPTAGLRRLSPGHHALNAYQEAYAGLPEGVPRGGLLHIFKAAAPRLGLRARLLLFIEQLVVMTSECDWLPGATPIAWPSNDELMARLGLGRTAVQNLIREAQRLGLVAMKDSATGRRHGDRDKRGNIKLAFGFDLSPLAARYEEFATYAQEALADRQEQKRLKREISRNKREVRRLAADALTHGYEGFDWQDALVRAQASDMRSLRLAELRLVGSAVRDLALGVDKAWTEASRAEESGPAGSVIGAPYIPTTDLPTGSTYQDPRGVVVAPKVELDEGTTEERLARALKEEIRLELVIDAIPEIHPYLPHGAETMRWSDLHAAAELARYDLGIHPTLWSRAQRTLGLDNAAAAVAYTLANQAEGRITRSAGGYYKSLIDRAMSGELRLRDSLWGKLGRPQCLAAKEAHRARRKAHV